MKTVYKLGIALTVLITACDQNRNNATLGNSQDTTNINRAGGGQIKDTATINKDRKDSAANVPVKPNTAKGNADPSGHLKNQ